MEFRILGPLGVVAEGPPPKLGSPKQRALLAFLLLHANEVVSRDRLIEALWGENAPPTAAHAVEVYVSRLRKALASAPGAAPQLETRAPGYVFELEPGGLDVDRFERLRSEGRRALEEGELEVAAGKLREALAVWRGPALTDFSYEPFAQDEIGRLDELRLATLEERVEADLALARHPDLVPELEKLVAEHPLRERLRAQLMLALYRSGRQTDALAAYRKARSTLVEELGLEPGPELRRLETAILAQDPALAVEPAELGERRRLPAPATPLVGRRAEVDEVAGLLRGEARLVTVTGPGGIGKTRVALQAAYELADRFPHGVVFVGLAAVRDPDLVSAEIATALGVEDSNGTLVEHLRARDLLLLVDNFEQVEEAAPALGSLLREAQGLKLLVTSRHPVRVYGEHRLPIPPLALEEEAVPLFLTRAGAAGRRVAPTETVVEICRRLDCLPLAIELAAARAADYSPAELLDLLPRPLDLAAAGPRDVPERQQTLRAAIEWSFGLLEPVEQALFARLSVFAGGFTAEAAETVCDAAPAGLKSLVEKSLLSQDGERFDLLETIREYAAERLGDEADAVGRLHAEYFLALALEADRVTQGGEQADWWARLEDDHDNLRAALVWFESAGEVEDELRLVAALWGFWSVYGYINEGRRRLDAALERGSSRSRARARALHGAGALAYRQGDYERARALFQESRGVHQDVGDEVGSAKVLGELGNIAVAEGDYDRALEFYDRCAAGLRRAGMLGPLGQVVANMGAVANMQRDFERGRQLLEEALALHRESGNSDGLAVALHNLARVHLRTGQPQEAASRFHEALEVAAELRYREVIAHCLEGVAELTLAAGDPLRAARLVGAADALLEELGITMSGDDAEMYATTIEALRRQLGDRFDDVRSRGRVLPLPEAVEEATAAAGEAKRPGTAVA